MSVVHFKTVLSEVIWTNMQVFSFKKFFLLTGKRWNEIPFLPYLWDLFEKYGAEQKGMTAKGVFKNYKKKWLQKDDRVKCSSFPPNFRLNAMMSR